MNIGSQIKKRRNELAITQQELANRLNVSRSAVSNWELERNYPDVQTIINLSDILEISLDTLLKGDVEVINKLTKDTKKGKKNRYIILCLLILLISVSSCFFYSSHKIQSIKTPSQIEKITVSENEIRVELNLPKYRSLGTWDFSSSSDKDTVVELRMSSRIDLSFSNDKELTVPIDPNSEMFKDAKVIQVISDSPEEEKVIYSVDVPDTANK